jgi:para-aminobenzoate synthetase
MQTLIIDHYDSFTYNLFQLVAEIQGIEPIVIAHDSKDLHTLSPNAYDNIILSPGPGHPDNIEDFSSKDFVLKSDKPILGVCLGHQGLFTLLGGKVQRAPKPVHGCVNLINHNQDPLYANIPSPFRVMRYHSLICTLPAPKDLEITAWTEDGLIMGFRHNHKPIWGIQYHPESIASEFGRQLLLNFKHLTSEYYEKRQQTLPSLQHSLPPTPASITVNTPQIWTLLSHKRPFTADPAGVFQRLFSHTTPALWLDSSQIIPEFSRFTYMGAPQGPAAYQLSYDAKTQTLTQTQGQHTTEHAMSIFVFLKQYLQQHTIHTSEDLPFEFHGGFIGYFGYELNQETANITNARPSSHPDAYWVFLDRFLVFDHQEHLCYVVSISSPEHLESNTAWLESTSQMLQDIVTPERESTCKQTVTGTWIQAPEIYMHKIKACLDFIDAGDSYELCLTNKLQFPVTVDPLQFYLNLRHCHPAPHAAFFQLENLAIACSSMERFLKIDRQRQIQTKPIKGTLPRGKTPQEDQTLANHLRDDEKFHAEHLMIVDLLRNDLGKICQIGSVQVADLMKVETYATVHQLISLIIGNLLPGIDVIDCIQHVFPGGSMTGAPKIRAMTLLNQLETQARGIYSGSLGYLSLNGAVDLNIVIRTAEITPEQMSIGAGGAIIALSDPAEEFAEMVLKTRALQTALGMTQCKGT